VTGTDARLRRLEKLSARPQPLSPDQTWTAINELNGTPDDVESAISPLLPQLQSSMLIFSQRVLDQRRAGSAPPYSALCLQPVRVLAEIIAHPPGEPIDDTLIEYRKRHRYNPDWWLKVDPGIPGHLLSFGHFYAQWLLSQISWLVCPEPDAISLRHRLQHNAPPPDVHLIEAGQLSIEVWPEGIFRLLKIPMIKKPND
jgi:hypothetical protein